MKQVCLTFAPSELPVLQHRKKTKGAGSFQKFPPRHSALCTVVLQRSPRIRIPLHHIPISFVTWNAGRGAAPRNSRRPASPFIFNVFLHWVFFFVDLCAQLARGAGILKYLNIGTFVLLFVLFLLSRSFLFEGGDSICVIFFFLNVF